MNISVSMGAVGRRGSSRTQRLRELTHGAHDRIDKRIMAAHPFVSRERYGSFLGVQYHFHRDIAALYGDVALQALFPDLEERPRLELIEADLADISLSVPVSSYPPAFSPDPDIASALGWLYVAEGSNLGAAILLKRVTELGLDEHFGARHLGGHPQGRGLHWRKFSTALDGVQLSDEQEERVIAGGVSAFNRVHELVEQVFE